MSKAASSTFGSRTLRNLGLAVLAIATALGVADVLRGTGGRAWLSSEAHAVPAATEGDPTATVFRAVRVFDGVSVVDSTDVVVQDGIIVAMEPDAEVPVGATVIEGTGRTLVPGLIDAHTHAFGPVLRAALMMGVTAELDMFTEPNGARILRAEQARGDANGRADLFSAGVLATAPGGHGTEYGMEIPTLTTPEEADDWVQARVDEGSDYIKIVYDDGSIAREFATLDLPTVEALIEAAHARDLLAVVHVGREADARAVIEAGADGIVHVFYDQPASDAAVEAIATSGAFVVPTLAVLESVSGGSGGRDLLEDERLAPYISSNERQTLEVAFPSREEYADVITNGLASIGRLHAAGVTILAGTDAPNPGTAHGASMHRELELLVEAGLSPGEALAAATSTPATKFGLDDRGRVAVGLRADLVLVTGHPDEDVLASRDIVGVWKAGVEADREGYRAELAVVAEGAPVLQIDDGLIADFDNGNIDSVFGSGWMLSTDDMIGGSSTAAMTVAEAGADGSAGAMRVDGTIAGTGPARWAGPMFFPGVSQFAPANLSEHSGISFMVRGDGQPVAIMMFAVSLGQVPSQQYAGTSDEWTRVELRFEDFAGLDAAGLQGVLFSGTESGDFEFEIDDLRVW